MALEAPNCFEEAGFKRMRTASRPFDPSIDYSRIIAQLKESCREFGYLAIAPQNLVEPAVLESVIVMPYYDKPVRAFVDPIVTEQSGERTQYEGCANIQLVRNGKKFPPYVRTYRPTRLVLSHVVDGKRVTTTYRDRRPQSSFRISAPSLICHEINHIDGMLLTDIARRRLLHTRKLLMRGIKAYPGEEKGLRREADRISPFAMIRDGERYTLRLASELGNGEVPAVSPDAVYLDYLHVRHMRDISRVFVPRDGELLPIVPSEAFLSL